MEIEKQNKGTTKPPTWVADASVSACELCKSSFTLFNRRHHCRACGHIFCGTCTDKNTPLPQYSLLMPQKVCTPCYDIQNNIFSCLQNLASENDTLQKIQHEKVEWEEDYSKVLSQGQLFFQHRKKGNPRAVKLSLNSTTFEVKEVQKGIVKLTFGVHDIIDVIENGKTEMFQKQASKLKGNINCCFTVVLTKMDAVDLRADTPDIAYTWVGAIKGLVDYLGPKNKIFAQRKRIRDIEYNIQSNIDKQRLALGLDVGHSNKGLTSSGAKSDPSRRINTSGVAATMAENREKLNQRGEALSRAEEATAELAEQSSHFLDMCRQLKQEMKNY
eukprot:TRINITY_DN9527_c0_g1_i1.p1 TRINITY_DN9527_c0_g1~~TRINITY_DN9527_c0_g1_i1.p1  ORF type:complete len:330 (-),score=63.79 TRINITY_DN9527_c0_g1_i1:28-1017(-)